MGAPSIRGVLWLCDGKVPDCPKTYCAHNGTGRCRRTSRREHALHKDADPRGFEFMPVEKEDAVYLVEPTDV